MRKSISEFDDRLVKITQTATPKEKKKQKIWKKQYNIPSLWENVKGPSVHIIGISEHRNQGKERNIWRDIEVPKYNKIHLKHRCRKPENTKRERYQTNKKMPHNTHFKTPARGKQENLGGS